MRQIVRCCLLVVLGAGCSHCQPVIESVTDVATYQPGPISPGSIAVVFGSGLALQSVSASSLPLPFALGGARVTVDGTPAALFYASPTQINLQVPWGLFSRTFRRVPVRVQVDGSGVATADVELRYVAPRLLAGSHGMTGELITAESPAIPGETVTLYAVGLGSPRTVPADGVAQGSGLNPVVDIQCRVGGQLNEIVWEGLTPGLVSVYQLNVRLDATTPGGDSVPVQLFGFGDASNVAELYVAPRMMVPGGPVEVRQVMVSLPAVTGSASLTGWVGLTAPAAVNTDVVLTSSHPAVLVPGQATVSAGRVWASFPVQVSAVEAAATAGISASVGGAPASATLELVPVAVPPAPSAWVGRTLRLRGSVTSAGTILPVTVDLTPDGDRHLATVQTTRFAFDFQSVAFTGESLHAGVLGSRNDVFNAPYSVVSSADLNVKVTAGGVVSGTLALTIRTVAPLGLAVGYSVWNGSVNAFGQ